MVKNRGGMVLYLFSIQSIMGGNEGRKLQAGSEEDTAGVTVNASLPISS